MTAEGQKKKAVIAQMGGYVSTPLGDSMRPMLRGRQDSVLVVAITRPVKRGDVLLYEASDGRHVLHRVVEVLEQGYRMRGDHCFGEEPILFDDSIIGILEGFWKKDKFYSCDKDKGYRRYVKFWLWSFPFRRLLARLTGALRQENS